MVNSVISRWPDPVAAKQAQIITRSPPCFTVGMRCRWDVQKTFFQKCFVQMQLLFWEASLSLVQLEKDCLFNLLLPWTSTFSKVNRAHRVWDVAAGFFEGLYSLTLGWFCWEVWNSYKDWQLSWMSPTCGFPNWWAATIVSQIIADVFPANDQLMNECTYLFNSHEKSQGVTIK